MAHIYINGFKIIQNTGITRDNTINILSSQLSSGKSFHKAFGDSSEEIKFKSVLKVQQLDENVTIGRSEKNSEEIAKNKLIHEAYKLLAERSKTEALTITILDKEKKLDTYKSLDNDKIVNSHGQTFKGRIKELTWEYPVGNYREYSWTIIEDADFKPASKTFNTFNYKSPSVTAKKTVTNTPSYIKALYKCNMAQNCGKYKVKCVYHLQKLLQSDGYYRQYKYDGLWCTYTTQEFKKWQKKKAKVKVTGKFDKATKAYLKKRFKL